MLEMLPEPLPAERVAPHLDAGERVVSGFGPYLATSRRVLLLSERGDGSRTYELRYEDLESISEVRVSDRKRLALGAALLIGGTLTLFAWYLIAPIVAIVMGALVILQGSVGRPAYYQLKARGMEERDLRRWQVKRYGAGSFIASITAMTGVEVAEA